MFGTGKNIKSKKPNRNPTNRSQGYRKAGRVWLEKDGELYLGWGRVVLLERVGHLGSITEAAKSMNLGYRNAWLWIESMNRLAPSPLVEKTVGGVGGGHAELTEEGKKAILEYKQLRAKFRDFLKSNT